MTWVANVCPQVKPFLTMIWAALSSRSYGEFVHGKQVELPLKWIAAFVNNVKGPLRRHFRPRAAMAMVVTFDGSPEGGGATLQLAVPTNADRGAHKIEYYWHTKWTSEDEKVARAAIGDPASQAKWEAYTLLLAIAVWQPALACTEGQLVFVGDALGVLHDAMKFTAKDPALNRLMAELALRVAPCGFELSAVHIWSSWNDVCDELSRNGRKASQRDELRAATASRDTRPRWLFL